MATHVAASKTVAPRRFKYVLLGVLLVILAVGSYPLGRQMWAMWHYQAAQTAIDKRDFATAQRHLQKTLRVWNTSGETVFLTARTARRAGDLDAADQLLKEAQRLNWVPEAIAVERSLLRVQNGDYHSVLPYLISCVRRDHPDSLLILEILVPAMTRSYEIGPLIECLDMWIQKDPANPRPYMLRGDVAERLRGFSEAITMYRKVLELAPDHVEANFRLGAVLLSRKFPGEAWPHLEFAQQRLDAAPNLERLQVRTTAAHCLHELGRDDEARRILKDLHKSQPDDFRVLGMLGLVELDSGNFDLAEGLLRRAAALNRFEPTLLSNFERCLRLNQKAGEANEVKKRIDRIDADLKDLDALMPKIRAEPADPELRRQVAIRLMRNGLELEAKRWLESALQQNPMHGPSYDTLADYYSQTGDLVRAEEYRQRAKELTPKR